MAVCDVPVIHKVCNAAGDAAGAVVTAPFDWLAKAMGGAAAWMFTSVWHVIDTTTYVDVTSGEYTKVYDIIFGIAAVLAIGFFLLQVIAAMLRREPAALSRAALGLAKSILGSFVALTLLASALEITDQLCIGIVNAAGTNMKQMGDKVALLATGLDSINLSASGAGAILTIVLASLAIGGALVVWFSLLIRKALLLVAIVFAPVALAGSSWDHTRSWLSRWATFVIAMILSKLVLVVIFLLATAQVAAPIGSDLQSVSQPISGVVLMLMAGFAPYMTYKAIAFIGFDMHHAMSAEQETKGAFSRPAAALPLARLGGWQTQSVLSGARSDAGGGPGTSAASGSGGGGGPVPGGGGMPGAGSSVGAGAAGTGAGAAAAGGAATGGASLAKEAGTTGPKLGGAVGAAAGSQADAGQSIGRASGQASGEAAAPSTTPPHVADSTLDEPRSQGGQS